MTIKSYYGPDVILVSINNLAEQNVQAILEHVKGHQDSVVSSTPLSRPATILNIEANCLAGMHLELDIPEYYEFDANNATLQVNGTIITSKYKSILRNSYLTQSLCEFMVKKYDWDTDILEKNW